MLPIKRILCPTDFSEPSYEALKTGSELCVQFGAELCLVHIVPPIPPLPADPGYVLMGVDEYEKALTTDALRRLGDAIKERVPAEVRSRASVGRGEAASEIVRMAEAEDADLIVIATHGLTGWKHVVFGSIAERVVRMAQCPVLTVHARRD